MEKGVVKSFDKNSGMGFISRTADKDVKFYANSVIGRSLSSLQQGDAVWFEVDCIQTLHIAINIRKCS